MTRRLTHYTALWFGITCAMVSPCLIAKGEVSGGIVFGLLGIVFVVGAREYLR